MSLLGIVLGLVLLMFLAYRGYSIIWVAPVCAVVVAVLSGYAILDAYIGDYMKGMADYVFQWFPPFFLGAVYGKVMDMTGSARSLGNALVKLIGSRFAVLAVVAPCLLMTFGGISLFVVVFVIYPMGYSIYRAADLPRTLLPGAIATGAFGITMTAIPGTPQIQNIIPTNYYGTTATAAPLLSVVAIIVMFVPAYAYLEWRAHSARKKGLHFVPDPKHVEVNHDDKNLPSWHWVTGIIPVVVVVLMLNVFPLVLENATGFVLTSSQAMVVALLCGIIVACLLNLNQAKILLPAINEGANGSMGAIMNAGLSLKWFNSLFERADYNQINEQAAKVRPGSGGVVFLPYLNGERTPHVNPNLSGMFLGVNLNTGRPELTRAVMEGVAFALNQCIEVCGGLGLKADTMVASGGGARSGPWLQIQADIYGIPLKVADTEEQAGLGSAIAAGVGAGIYRDIEDGCRAVVRY